MSEQLCWYVIGNEANAIFLNIGNNFCAFYFMFTQFSTRVLIFVYFSIFIIANFLILLIGRPSFF